MHSPKFNTTLTNYAPSTQLLIQNTGELCTKTQGDKVLYRLTTDQTQLGQRNQPSHNSVTLN